MPSVLQLLCEDCMRLCETGPKHPIHQLTLCRHVTPKENRVTTSCTLWATPSVTEERNSSVLSYVVFTFL